MFGVQGLGACRQYMIFGDLRNRNCKGHGEVYAYRVLVHFFTFPPCASVPEKGLAQSSNSPWKKARAGMIREIQLNSMP